MSSKASSKSENMVSPLSRSSCVQAVNRSCKALWAGLSGFCVVPSQNHAYMEDYASIGALLLRIKSTKYLGGCSSKISDSVLCVIGTTLGTSSDPFLRAGRKFVSKSLKLSLVGDRFEICSGYWLGFG